MSLVIHQSGIEAAINAQANGFSGATLSDVDLYNGNTLIKRLPLKGVQVIEPTRIYVVAVDETVGAAYDVTRMEFRTDGNVLYATAQLADGGIIQSKGPYTTLMLTEQINLSAAPGTIAPSGDLSLYAFQATEEMLGTAEIATQVEVDEGTDNTRFVTPKKLKAWWDTLRTWVNIKDKPDTATRWPEWNEISSRPDLGSAAGLNAGQDDGQVALIGHPSLSGYVGVMTNFISNANGQAWIFSNGLSIQKAFVTSTTNHPISTYKQVGKAVLPVPISSFMISIAQHTGEQPLAISSFIEGNNIVRVNIDYSSSTFCEVLLLGFV